MKITAFQYKTVKNSLEGRRIVFKLADFIKDPTQNQGFESEISLNELEWHL